MRTLVLNAGYEPLAVVSFKRALVLVMNEKATVIELVEGEPVWGARGSYERPAVILLTRYVRVPGGRRVPVTRRGVLRRDAHRCAYCGNAASTIDHVLPRSRVICTRPRPSHRAHHGPSMRSVMRPPKTSLQGAGRAVRGGIR